MRQSLSLASEALVVWFGCASSSDSTFAECFRDLLRRFSTALCIFQRRETHLLCLYDVCSHLDSHLLWKMKQINSQTTMNYYNELLQWTTCFELQYSKSWCTLNCRLRIHVRIHEKLPSSPSPRLQKQRELPQRREEWRKHEENNITLKRNKEEYIIVYIYTYIMLM